MFEVKAFLTVDNHGPARQSAWYGWVLEYAGLNKIHTREDFGKLDGTANGINIKALGLMAKRLKAPCRICLHTNSRHLEAAISNGWLQTWAENDWKNSSGEEIKNRDLWEKAWESLKSHELTAVYEKEHSYHSWILTEIKSRKEGEKNGSHVPKNPDQKEA